MGEGHTCYESVTTRHEQVNAPSNLEVIDAIRKGTWIQPVLDKR